MAMIEETPSAPAGPPTDKVEPWELEKSPSAADEAAVREFHSAEEGKKSEKLLHALPFLPQLWNSLLAYETGVQSIWKASVPFMAYNGVLFASLLSIDSILHLHAASTRPLAYVLLSVALSPLRMLWTQKLITTLPSHSRPLSRHDMVNAYRALALPSLANSGAFGIVVIAVLEIGRKASHQELHWDWISATWILAIPTAGLALFAILSVPTAIVLTRIEAALLPSTQQAVVAFDRTLVNEGQDKSEATTIWTGPFYRALVSLDFNVLLRVLRQYVWWGILLFVAVGIHN
jgi:hypothetical protein